MSSVPGGFFFLILALHSFQKKKKKSVFSGGGPGHFTCSPTASLAWLALFEDV